MSNSDNIDNQEAVKLEARVRNLVLELEDMPEDLRAMVAMTDEAKNLLWLLDKARTTPAKLDAPDNQEALVLVPREPTEEMWRAAETAIDDFSSESPAGQYYRAMIAAAPSRTLPSNEALAGDDRNGVGAWTQCPKGSCHRHRGCQYTPCLSRTPSSPQADVADVERELAEAVWSAEIDGAPGYTMKMRLSWNEALRIARAVRSTMTTRPAGGEEVDVRGAIFNLADRYEGEARFNGGLTGGIYSDVAKSLRAALTKPAALPKEGEVGPWEAMLTLTKAADAAAEWITEARASAEATSSWTTLPYEKGLPQGAQGKREVRNIRAAIRKARAALTPPQATDSGVDLDPPMKRI